MAAPSSPTTWTERTCTFGTTTFRWWRSRVPWPEFEPFKKRMGWRFKWVSSGGSDFNRDYHVSFTKEDLAKGPTYYN